MDYDKLVSSLKNSAYPEEDASKIRDALRKEFQSKQTMIGKAITERVLQEKAKLGIPSNKNNPSKTNVKVTKLGQKFALAGKGIFWLGVTVEISNIALAEDKEREAVKAGGRVGGSFVTGMATGWGASFYTLNPYIIWAFVLIGGIVGSVAGEGIVEACINEDGK